MYNKNCVNLSRFFPFLVIAGISAGFLFSLILKRVDLAIRGLTIALPAFFSLLFLHNPLSMNTEFKDKISFFSLNPKISFLVYVLLYLNSIVFLLMSEIREWTYIICLLFLYVLIFVQIFSVKLNPKLVLFEILLLQVNLIYGVTLHYPLYFGGTDLLVHNYISQVTYALGHVVPLDFSLYYRYFPLYHIFMAQSSYLLGIDVVSATFLITCPIFVVTILFLYCIISMITKNVQFSLLCCLLFATDSNVMYYGTYVVTRTLAFVGFIILLYFIYCVKADPKNKIIYKILSVFMCLFLILVHQVSIIQISILIITLSLCESIVNGKQYINKNFVFLLDTLFLAYWFYIAYLFTRAVLISRFQAEHFDKLVVLSNIGTTNEWIYLLKNLDVSIFVFFALIGIRYMLSKNKWEYSYVWGLFALLTLILYIPSPIQTLWQAINLFTFDRFLLFLSPFMVIPMGVGIYVYYEHFFLKGRIFRLLPIFLFLIFTFTSLSYSISDSHDIFDDLPNKYFNERELQGFNYISDYAPLGSEIYSDYYTNRFFIQDNLNDPNLKLPYFTSKYIATVGLLNDANGYTVFREEELSKRGLFFGNGAQLNLYSNSKQNIFTLVNILTSHNKIYSNSAIDVFFNNV